MKKYFNIISVLIVFIFIFFILKIIFDSKETNTSLLSKNIKNKIENGAKFSDFVEFEKRIKIQDNDSLLLDYVSQDYIAYSDSLLIIANPEQKQIWIINNEGKILRVFGKSGEGPGEFLSISRFTVSPNNFIYIYDESLQRFSIFNTKGELIRIIKFKNSDIMIRGLRVNKKEEIFIHHPPHPLFKGYISKIDINGNIIKTLQSDVKDYYSNYYFRGFVGGDILLLEDGKIIESNIFANNKIYIGDEKNKFTIIDAKSEKFYEIPKISGNDYNKFRKISNELPTILNFYNYKNEIIFQHFIPPLENNSTKRILGYIRVFDLNGYYLGNINLDNSYMSNPSDNNYLIGIEINRISRFNINERIPYNFIIYKWKDLEI